MMSDDVLKCPAGIPILTNQMHFQLFEQAYMVHTGAELPAAWANLDCRRATVNHGSEDIKRLLKVRLHAQSALDADKVPAKCVFDAPMGWTTMAQTHRAGPAIVAMSYIEVGMIFGDDLKSAVNDLISGDG